MSRSRVALLAAAATAAAVLAGCVVAPVGPPPIAYGAVHVPPPAYALPAPGYVWGRHPHDGWGWRHPYRGWHRGWR